MKRKRLLLDVDQVIANFHKPFYDVVFRVLGRKVSDDDFDQWDLLAKFPRHEQDKIVKELCAPGYCSTFPVLGDAKEAIKEVRKYVNVTPVTRPFPASPTWVYDRACWLEEHFGFKEHEIVNTAAKFLVDGDAFLDDHPENVTSWQSYHPRGVAMLWHSPSTRFQTEYDHIRIHTWDEVIRKARDL